MASERPRSVLDDVVHADGSCRSSGSEEDWPPHHGLCVGPVCLLLLSCLAVGVLSICRCLAFLSFGGFVVSFIGVGVGVLTL